MLVGFIVSTSACGCAGWQLGKSARRQASILPNYQQRLVLENLAKFVRSPHSVPGLAVIKKGSIDVADNIGLNFNDILTGSRGVNQHWETSPEADDNTAKLLQMAFQIAVTGQRQFLTPEAANDMGFDLAFQMGTNSDISTDLDTVQCLAMIRGSSAPTIASKEPTRAASYDASAENHTNHASRTDYSEITSTLTSRFW